MENKSIETKFAHEFKGVEGLQGETKIREVKTMVNQSVFRQIVIANYAGKCAISGINIRELLVASHIIPWAKNENERLNPENGICLSTLYYTAFDKGFIGLNDKYEILISKELKQYEREPFYSTIFGYLTKKYYSSVKILTKKGIHPISLRHNF